MTTAPQHQAPLSTGSAGTAVDQVMELIRGRGGRSTPTRRAVLKPSLTPTTTCARPTTWPPRCKATIPPSTGARFTAPSTCWPSSASPVMCTSVTGPPDGNYAPIAPAGTWPAPSAGRWPSPTPACSAPSSPTWLSAPGLSSTPAISLSPAPAHNSRDSNGLRWPAYLGWQPPSEAATTGQSAVRRSGESYDACRAPTTPGDFGPEHTRPRQLQGGCRPDCGRIVRRMLGVPSDPLAPPTKRAQNIPYGAEFRSLPSEPLARPNDGSRSRGP